MLRVRSASRLLHIPSPSLVGTLSDSSPPSLEGDRISLQLGGDIILEHLHAQDFSLTPALSRRRIRLSRFSEEQFHVRLQHPLRRLVTHPGLAAELNRKSLARSFA